MFKNKRVIAIVMTLMMVVGMLPGMAFAAGGSGSGSGGGSGAGSEVKIKVNGGGSEFSVNVGEKLKLEPEVTGAEEGTYHIHWVKNDNKKYFQFIKNNGTAVDGNEAFADKINVLGLQETPAADSIADIIVSVYEGASHDACTGKSLASKDLTLNVVGTGEEKDPYAYGPQGKDLKTQSVIVKSPADITQLYPASDDDQPTVYINKFESKFDASKDIEIIFQMGKGMGNYKEDEFIEYGIKNITVLSADEKTVVASYEKGNLKYLGMDNITERNLTIALPADTLAADTEYVLVFGEKMQARAGHGELGVDVKFQMTTKKDKNNDGSGSGDSNNGENGNGSGDQNEPGANDKDPADKSDDAIKTGDDFNMIPFIAMMIAALIAAGAAVVRRKEN